MNEEIDEDDQPEENLFALEDSVWDVIQGLKSQSCEIRAENENKWQLLQLNDDILTILITISTNDTVDSSDRTSALYMILSIVSSSYEPKDCTKNVVQTEIWNNISNESKEIFTALVIEAIDRISEDNMTLFCKILMCVTLHDFPENHQTIFQKFDALVNPKSPSIENRLAKILLPVLQQVVLCVDYPSFTDATMECLQMTAKWYRKFESCTNLVKEQILKLFVCALTRLLAFSKHNIDWFTYDIHANHMYLFTEILLKSVEQFSSNIKTLETSLLNLNLKCLEFLSTFLTCFPKFLPSSNLDQIFNSLQHNLHIIYNLFLDPNGFMNKNNENNREKILKYVEQQTKFAFQLTLIPDIFQDHITYICTALIFCSMIASISQDDDDDEPDVLLFSSSLGNIMVEFGDDESEKMSEFYMKLNFYKTLSKFERMKFEHPKFFLIFNYVYFSFCILIHRNTHDGCSLLNRFLCSLSECSQSEIFMFQSGNSNNENFVVMTDRLHRFCYWIISMLLNITISGFTPIEYSFIISSLPQEFLYNWLLADLLFISSQKNQSSFRLKDQLLTISQTFHPLSSASMKTCGHALLASASILQFNQMDSIVKSLYYAFQHELDTAISSDHMASVAASFCSSAIVRISRAFGVNQKNDVDNRCSDKLSGCALSLFNQNSHDFIVKSWVLMSYNFSTYSIKNDSDSNSILYLQSLLALFPLLHAPECQQIINTTYNFYENLPLLLSKNSHNREFISLTFQVAYLMYSIHSSLKSFSTRCLGPIYKIMQESTDPSQNIVLTNCIAFARKLCDIIFLDEAQNRMLIEINTSFKLPSFDACIIYELVIGKASNIIRNSEYFVLREYILLLSSTLHMVSKYIEFSSKSHYGHKYKFLHEMLVRSFDTSWDEMNKTYQDKKIKSRQHDSSYQMKLRYKTAQSWNMYSCDGQPHLYSFIILLRSCAICYKFEFVNSNFFRSLLIMVVTRIYRTINTRPLNTESPNKILERELALCFCTFCEIDAEKTFKILSTIPNPHGKPSLPFILEFTSEAHLYYNYFTNQFSALSGVHVLRLSTIGLISCISVPNLLNMFISFPITLPKNYSGGASPRSQSFFSICLLTIIQQIFYFREEKSNQSPEVTRLRTKESHELEHSVIAKVFLKRYMSMKSTHLLCENLHEFEILQNSVSLTDIDVFHRNGIVCEKPFFNHVNFDYSDPPNCPSDRFLHQKQNDWILFLETFIQHLFLYYPDAMAHVEEIFVQNNCSKSEIALFRQLKPISS